MNDFLPAWVSCLRGCQLPLTPVLNRINFRLNFLWKTRFLQVLIWMLLCQLSQSSFAQPLVEWSKTFSATSQDLLTTVKQTSDGGYIAGGRSNSTISSDKSQPSRGRFDYWVVKVAADGSKQWDKTFGGDNEEVLAEVFQTADGGYLLAGNSISNASGDKSQNDRSESKTDQFNGDYWIVKINAAGEKQWDKTIGGTLEEYLYDARQMSDGSILLFGSSSSGISADKTQAPVSTAGDSDF